MDILDTYVHLGEDSPTRAKIAYEIMSKALDLSKLVRVQRTISRNGKSFVTHKWVSPGSVKKGDIVIKNKDVLEQWQKENGAKAAEPAKQKTAESKSGSAEKKGVKNPAAPKLEALADAKTSAAKPKAKGVNPLAKLAAKQAKSKPKVASKKTTVKPPETSKPEAKTSPKPSETKPEPKPSAKPPEKTQPAKPEGKPEKSEGSAPASKPEPKSQPEPEPKPAPKADIFSDKSVNPKLVTDIYAQAKLDESDTLASSASYKAACDALDHLKQTVPNFGDLTYKEATIALAVQHYESLDGKEQAAAVMQKLEPIKTSGYFNSRTKYAAVKAWTEGGQHAAIRQQSVTHNTDADPISAMYSRCLTDLIRYGNTEQQGTLYRGIHASPDFLRSALEKGSFSTKGLVSTTADMKTARQFALNTKSGELPVILEIPPSLKMKTLELDNESLLSTHGSFSVGKISQDADGIYHVQVKLPTAEQTDPIADDDTYAKFGAEKPDPSEHTKPEPSDYKAVINQYLPKPVDYPDRYQVVDVLDRVYQDYGYEGAKECLAAYAKTTYLSSTWLNKFSYTKSGNSPALIEFVRTDWIGSGYRGMRNNENTELNSSSTGKEVYYKIANDVLNDLVKHDGVEQPGMLTRGLRGQLTEYRSAQVGSEVTIGAISSFTTSTKTSNKFAQSCGVVLKIMKKSKVRCSYVAGLKEEEYIVQNGSFRVVKREMKQNRLYLTLEPVNAS